MPNGNVRFIELKSPVRSKTFFVIVPTKYSMSTKSKTTTIHIPDDTSPTIGLMDYWTQIRLPETHLNFAVFAGEYICYIPTLSDDVNTVYQLGGTPTITEEDDEVTKLEKEALELKTTIRRMRHPPVNVADLVDPAIQPVDDPVNIVFKDVEGEPIERGSDMEKLMDDSVDAEPDVLPSETQQVDADSEKVVDEVVAEDVDVDEDTYRDGSDSEESSTDEVPINDVPIQTENIGLGMIYIVYSIKEFFIHTKDENFEFEIVRNYDELDDAEVQLRLRKVGEMTDIIDRLKEHISSKLEEIEKAERSTKEQIVKLSGIYHQTHTLLKRSKTKRYTVSEEQVLSLEQRTKSAVGNANTELCKHKEQANALISKYLVSLAGMMAD